MFDLIAGREKHLPSHATVPLLLSTWLQATVIALVRITPSAVSHGAAARGPDDDGVRRRRARASSTAATARGRKAESAASEADATPAQNQFIAPLEEPAAIAELPDDEGFEFGVPGGVEGGIPGGVVGGVVGGLPEAPPPPPPPPPTPRAPVRIGGQIKPPQLLRRVEPEYPPLAVAAHIQGVVILEATVNEEGAVMDVKVLRSVNPILDREAERVVRQWRYSPVVLNEVPVPFVLTVTLSFSLEAK